jgi:hypothetical protein
VESGSWTGTRSWPGADDPPEIDEQTGSKIIHLKWRVGGGEAAPHILASRLTSYRAHSFAFPTVAGMTEPLHPLMAWWPVIEGDPK